MIMALTLVVYKNFRNKINILSKSESISQPSERTLHHILQYLHDTIVKKKIQNPLCFPFGGTKSTCKRNIR